jgi:hypothetical protein
VFEEYGKPQVRVFDTTFASENWNKAIRTVGDAAEQDHQHTHPHGSSRTKSRPSLSVSAPLALGSNPTATAKLTRQNAGNPRSRVARCFCF